MNSQTNKDPAFLFYSSDFLSGCTDLTMEERGQYITLLCLQHQKGLLTEKTIRLNVGSISVDVLKKFKKDDDGNFYNERLSQEIEKRLLFTESRRNNGSKGGRPKKEQKPNGKPLGLASENLVESENENDNINKSKSLNKIKESEIFTFENLFDYWEQNKKGGKYKKVSRSRMFEKLKELTNNDLDFAKKAIFHCIDSDYQGFCNGNELFYKKPHKKQNTHYTTSYGEDIPL